MKILHLIIKEKFTDGVVEFYNTFFNNGEHVIGYTNSHSFKGHYQKYSIPGIIIEKSGNRCKDYIRFKRYFDEYDYIVLHSLMAIQDISSLLFLLPSKYMKKIVWIEWGADLYDDRGGIKAWIRNRFKHRVDSFIAIFEPDIEEYKRRFPNSKASIFYAPYETSADVDPIYQNDYLGCKLQSDFENGKPIVIQIGQNQSSTLNHLKVLDLLSRFSDENIRLLIPLSYGGYKEYADEVQKKAEELFPGKTVVLRDYMPKEEYFDLLESVGIAIFDTYRQAALGNIVRLLWRNVKVYLTQDSVMYDYFIKQGAPVCSVESIEKESFFSFVQPPTINDKQKYDQYRAKFKDISISIKKWETIYDSLRRRIHG